MKKIFLSLLIVGIGQSSFGQIDRSKAPVPGPAPEINIADPEVFQLDNGMRVIVSSNSSQPKVSFNLVMTSDPKLEGEKAGLSDVTGDLMLSGTSNRDKDQLDNEKDFIGASLYASSSNVYLSCLTKHMDKGLDLMVDVVKNVSFPESEFDRIVKQYESSLASTKTDANQMASNATYKAVFSDEHPYGEVMTPKTLKNISREDVIEFYNNKFTPADSYLVIVGDIELDEAKKIAKENFNDWEGGVPYEKSYSKGELIDQNRVIFTEKPGAVQSVITIAFPIDMKPGDEDQIKLSVLNKVLGGGGFGTRLMQNLREDKAYTYGAYSSLNVNRQGSWISASGSFRNEVTDSAIVQFLYEFDRITKDLVTEEELELNKASMAGSFARRLESPRTIASYALNIFRNDLPPDYYQTYLQKLNAVTREDILEVAKKYITPDNLNIIVVGSTDVIPTIEQFSPTGDIIVFDEFGNTKEDEKFEEADITQAEVIENHLMAITQTKNMKKANKVIGKVKTMEQVAKMVPDQAPVELTMKKYFKAPHSNYTTIAFNGMTMMKEIYNEEAGQRATMDQSAGGLKKEPIDDEELESLKKVSGLVPELGMVCDGIPYDLLGIIEEDGTKYYVIEYKTHKTTTKAYYRKDDFMKVKTESITQSDEGAEISSSVFSDFKTVNKVIFPHSAQQNLGGASFTVTFEEININNKIDDDKFEF